ncbi:GNAT family N-acetyltransferase [Aquimarina sp. ERC-38]|uniref:GNAT family N-acetyltransferase n=1 Tax=Aquimarina sp. ERC-38 TaxID=2949996 RepID=UPI0022485D13|nr:GNAT family N-acetyltransferase [Aquimarina sp. ERC-38]UZO79945.1 GNAT family N-acetyltransferase [Aquimarina sp. ERC-38]
MELKLLTSDIELEQILELQNKNHYKNISPESGKKDGFVTVKYDFDLLQKMNNSAKQVIAVDKGKVIGYALVLLKEFKNSVPLLTPMFETFEKTKYKDALLIDFKYYVMGQICISEEYRRKGIFKSLYDKHKKVYANKFDVCVTEVSSSNKRSMRAHQKVGFKTLATFKDMTDEWNIIYWDWK